MLDGAQILRVLKASLIESESGEEGQAQWWCGLVPLNRGALREPYQFSEIPNSHQCVLISGAREFLLGCCPS